MKLAEALAKAQAEMPVVPRSRTGQVGPRRYKYADISDILQIVVPVLAKHGIALTQPLATAEGHTVLRTELHGFGEIIQSAMPIDVPADPQKFGSLLTYYRRYALSALVGVASDEDDDGEATKPETPKAEHPSTRRLIAEAEAAPAVAFEPARPQIRPGGAGIKSFTIYGPDGKLSSVCTGKSELDGVLEKLIKQHTGTPELAKLAQQNAEIVLLYLEKAPDSPVAKALGEFVS